MAYPKNRKSRAEDITGVTRNRLTVIERDRSNGNLRWKCLCECGNFCVATSNAILSGTTKSCGCYNIERVTSTDGISNHPLYNTWCKMLDRCYKITDKRYPLYGGRGVRVCEEWRSRPDGFLAFSEFMGERPSGMSLDRIDNDLDYHPNNCKWSTQADQTYNQRIPKRNSSGRVGVSWRDDCNKWYTSITVNKKEIYLGRFKSFEDACNARQEAEIKYYGKERSNTVLQ